MDIDLRHGAGRRKIQVPVEAVETSGDNQVLRIGIDVMRWPGNVGSGRVLAFHYGAPSAGHPFQIESRRENQNWSTPWTSLASITLLSVRTGKSAIVSREAPLRGCLAQRARKKSPP